MNEFTGNLSDFRIERSEAPKYDRQFTEARKTQGFKSQEHLDAFYAYYDHTQTCAECKKPGKGVWLFDGFQPTANRCDEAKRLDQIADDIAYPKSQQS